jgi:hypothetical protein
VRNSVSVAGLRSSTSRSRLIRAKSSGSGNGARTLSYARPARSAAVRAALPGRGIRARQSAARHKEGRP